MTSGWMCLVIEVRFVLVFRFFGSVIGFRRPYNILHSPSGVFGLVIVGPIAVPYRSIR